ncbi:hypothetical protein TVAG_227400 [Trichomonas vaginalis G3]|uniref:Uncharacterized protein n=1 Tax=Trichomonas vaginalis (strain ATCC PRA-98 / G3) TaxID=412133 RepID=A2G8W7_TRIV3|nr:WD40 repeat-like family [Trichomonas vaginalis G3]EAX86402.1 hypothetical protein TVAG_227400 [Trichomonas vaginalis G3]KAI5505383.1 WD40 repeat-like family [Trichomonas vaginalis G3]|eukprot:XP_001299332.1 hypothetical protein [Trichomonas vaginalis G3]
MEVSLSSQVEKIGLQEVFRRTFRIDKPAVVAELPNNEFIICSLGSAVFVSQRGSMKTIPLSLYTCKYIPEHDLVIGITNGVPQIIFFQGSPDFKPLTEPIRVHSPYINQIEYHERILVVAGSGFDIFSVDLKRLYFDPSHPIVTLKQLVYVKDNIYGSLFDKLYIDFYRKRILVPLGYGYSLYSFSGEIIKKNESLFPSKIRTSAYFPFTGEITASEVGSAKNIFKKFIITDYLGNIRAWDYLEKKIFEYALGNKVVMFSEFIDKKNLILITENFEVFIFNLKMQVLTKLLDSQGQILGISIYKNPLRLCLLYLSNVQIYNIYNPLEYYASSLEPQVRIMLTQNDLFCTRSSNGVLTFYPKTKEVPQNIISRSSTKVRDIVYDTDRRIFFIFENNVCEIFDKTQSLTDPARRLNFECSYMSISPSHTHIYILSPYNEVILLDYLNLSIIKKLRIDNDTYIGIKSSLTEILVFTRNSIITINNQTLTIKKNPIDEVVQITNDKELIGILYKNNVFTVFNANSWQIISTFRSTSPVKSISMLNGFFTLILEENQIIIGRYGRFAQQFSFQFEIYSAAVVEDQKLYICGPSFIAYIDLKIYYPFLLEQKDEKPIVGKPFFEIVKPPPIQIPTPQTSEKNLETSPIKEPPKTARRSGRFRVHEPAGGNSNTPRRSIVTISLRSMLDEMRAKSEPVFHEQDIEPAQLPLLYPK